MKVRIVVSVLLLFLATAVTAVGVYIIKDVSPEAPVETDPLPAPVEVAPLVRTHFVHELEALGTIRARRDAAVSSDVSGPITLIPDDIELGSVVKAGRLLAQVDPKDFQLAVAKGEAVVARANANLERASADIARQRTLTQLNREQLRLARSEYERLDKLQKKNLVSSQETERQELAWRRIEEEVATAESGLRHAQAEHAIGRAELASAEADLEQANENLRDTEVRAPFAGVIAAKNATLGERVAPGTILYQLADVATVKLDVRIPALDIHHLDTGIATKVFVRGLDEEILGRIMNIGPRADETTRSFPVEIFITNSGSRRLLPGMFARALIPVADYPSAILVPRESVVFKNGSPTVFVVDPERSVAIQRPVTISRRFGSRDMIGAGLEPGELLVTAGQRLLVNGAHVRIVTRRELRL